MRTKALLIGALPVPQEGPVVDISDGTEWEVEGDDAFIGRVTLLVWIASHSDPVEMPLNQDAVRFGGKRLRVRVDQEIVGQEALTLLATCIN